MASSTRPLAAAVWSVGSRGMVPFFFLCSQASRPGRDVRRARSKPQIGENPSITCQKSAIEFGLSVLLAFNFIRYEILCIFFWAHNCWGMFFWGDLV